MRRNYRWKKSTNQVNHYTSLTTTSTNNPRKYKTSSGATPLFTLTIFVSWHELGPKCINFTVNDNKQTSRVATTQLLLLNGEEVTWPFTAATS
jgi:hypothetical protein